jgi:hypothetical protein
MVAEAESGGVSDATIRSATEVIAQVYSDGALF